MQSRGVIDEPKAKLFFLFSIFEHETTVIFSPCLSLSLLVVCNLEACNPKRIMAFPVTCNLLHVGGE